MSTYSNGLLVGAAAGLLTPFLALLLFDVRLYELHTERAMLRLERDTLMANYTTILTACEAEERVTITVGEEE